MAIYLNKLSHLKNQGHTADRALGRLFTYCDIETLLLAARCGNRHRGFKFNHCTLIPLKCEFLCRKTWRPGWGCWEFARRVLRDDSFQKSRVAFANCLGIS